MQYQGINHVGIVVTDLARSARFMHETIGLPQHPNIPRWFRVGQCVIHLIELPDAGVNTTRYQQFQHVALQVDDLREVVRRLFGAAFEPFQMDFTGNTRPIEADDDDLSWGTGSVYVRDPDGNLFEFLRIGHGLFANEPDPFAAG